jgi:hypothetical protein
MEWKGRLALAAVLLVASSACGREPAPSIVVCAEILARRFPEARLVQSRADVSAHAMLDFEIGAWWKRAERGQLTCSFEEQPNGGLRLLHATLDGVAFSATERTVINADLLLADLRRADAATRAGRD